MSFRILHTADWHLGASLRGASRDDDHRHFLAWLRETLRATHYDAMLLAGDVFEYAQPSAEALRAYYDTLAALRREVPHTQLIICGGNHDSPSRLAAAQAPLSDLGVTIVGGFDGSVESLIVPIHGPTERPLAAVAAVPFVHEYRLGLRGSDSSEVFANSLQARFSELYTQAAAFAEQTYPGVPLIAMGHLTASDPDRPRAKPVQDGAEDEGGDNAGDGDSGVAVHRSEQIGGLSPAIFDPRFCYVALGHIHRMGAVDRDERVWYSGNPVALHRDEIRTPRYVLDVTFDEDGPTEIVPITVPAVRRILEVRGDREQVLAALARIRWSEPLAPFVYVTVDVEAYRIGLAQELAAATPEGVRLLDIQQEGPAPTLTDEEVGQRPQKKTVMQVFQYAFRLEHRRDPSEETVAAFAGLLSAAAEQQAAPRPRPLEDELTQLSLLSEDDA